MSNEKQIGLGLMQYVQDNDESYPAGVQYADGKGWAGELYTYVKSTKVFACPDDTLTSTNIVWPPNTEPYSVVSYAYNINLVTKPTGDGTTIQNGVTTLASLVAPANTVALSEVSGDAAVVDGSSGRVDFDSAATFGAYRFDGFGSVNVVKGDTGYLGNPAVITGANVVKPLGRHTDGSNFVMTDGHAKFLRGPQVSPGTSAMVSTDVQAKYSPSYGGTPIPTAAGTEASNPSFVATFSTN